jgi:hypothetical protein
MSEERIKILQMLKDGKISTDEADRLLDSLNGEPAVTQLSVKEKDLNKRFFRIEVESDTRDNVKINIPFSLTKMALGLLPKHAKAEMERNGIDLDSIVETIYQGADGKLVDIRADDGTVVKIYLD